MSARNDLYEFATVAFKGTGVPPIVHESLTKMLDAYCAEVLNSGADALEARVVDVDVDTRTTWAGMDAAYLRHLAAASAKGITSGLTALFERLGHPECPEALCDPETDTLFRCINGPGQHDWHQDRYATRWRDPMADQDPSQLDSPFSDKPSEAPVTVTDSTPIPLRWDRLVMHPDGSQDDQTIVCCLTDDGRPAALFLDDEYREALGGILLDPNPDDEAATQ